MPAASSRRASGDRDGSFGRAPGYTADGYFPRGVSSQTGELGIVRQQLNVGYPIWRDDDNTFITSIRVGHSLFSGEAILPTTGRPFPEQLWSLQLGLNSIHQFDNGWSGGLILGVGSASDQPFRSFDEVAANLGGFLRVPARNQRDSWLFSIMYSPLGAVNFPLPGVAYSWQPTERFRMNLGVPFSLHWEPIADWQLDLNYLPLLNITARLMYKLTDRMQLYSAYEFLNQTFFLADRVDRRDRFFAMEQRIVGGIRYQPIKYAVLDWHAGYSFDRYFGEGLSQFDSLRDRIDLAPGAFLGLAISIPF